MGQKNIRSEVAECESCEDESNTALDERKFTLLWLLIPSSALQQPSTDTHPFHTHTHELNQQENPSVAMGFFLTWYSCESPPVCSAPPLMNTGPTDGAAHEPLRSLIALENMIQLPGTLSFKKNNTGTSSAYHRLVSSSDHILNSPTRPPAVNFSPDLTP